MVYTAKTPGKKGTITDALNMKNIGIDNKTFQLIDERIPMVQKMELTVGERVEYRIASQGDLTVKGKINFIGRDKDAPAAAPQTAPIQPFVPPVSAPPAEPKREPRIVQGQYLSKTGSSVTLKDSKGNAEAWPADLDLIVFLNKPEGKVKVGDMVKVQLIDNRGEWVAKLMGAFDPSIPEKPFKTAQEILKENLDDKKAEQEKADAALAQINKEEAMKPVETIAETEAADLIARGEAAKMEKIRTEAAKHSEQMKKENDARKAVEAPKTPTMTQTTKEPEKPVQSATVALPEAYSAVTVPASFVKSQNPPILNPVREEQVDPGEPSEGEPLAPIEVGVHIDMGGYTNFDLKLADISGDRARQRIEVDSMKMIAVMRRLMTAAKKGY